MPVPVAALYRVSTLKQVKQDEQDSIPVQAGIIRNFVAQHPDWELVREYREEGVSAFKLSKDNRDIIQQVLADALNGVFKVLLVFKTDRLSRNSFEYPLLLWQFHQAGVDVIAVADGGKVLCVDDQMDKLIRFIEGWQAETESRNTSIRVSHAMRELAKKGHWSGGRPPYGFRLSNKKDGLPLVIDEHEANVLREMVRLYLEEGLGSKRIATYLNEKGYRTREGKYWRDNRVRDVLQNPIIAGLPAFDRTKPGSTPSSRIRIRAYNDLSKFIIPRDENGNPKPIPEYEIIPLDTWSKLMQKMKQNKPAAGEHSARAMSSTALLTGFLKCGYCGRGFISSGSNKTYARGKVYNTPRRYYRCTTHARIGGGNKLCEGQGSYSQKKVDTVFLRELETFLSELNPDELAKYIEAKQIDYLAEVSGRIKSLEIELKKARKVYAAWVQRLDDYFASPETSPYSEELLAGKVKEYQEMISRLKAELDNLKSEAKVEREKKFNLMEFSRRAPEWLELFKEAPVETKKQMLSQIIERVILYRDRLEIYYNVDLSDFLGTEKEAAPEIRLKVLSGF